MAVVQAGRAGLFVTATDTGAGKTAVGSALAGCLALRGCTVRVRKPIESGCMPHPRDALTLQQAAGHLEPLTHICPWPLAHPIAPERAAQLAGTHLTLTDLTSACHAHVEAGDFLLVEGAGGFLSPLAPGVRNAELAVALGLPVLLVVHDRLGCLNHALLTAEAITIRGLQIAAVVLNRCGSAPVPEMDNASDLTRWLGQVVYCLPELPLHDQPIDAHLSAHLSAQLGARLPQQLIADLHINIT